MVGLVLRPLTELRANFYVIVHLGPIPTKKVAGRFARFVRVPSEKSRSKSKNPSFLYFGGKGHQKEPVTKIEKSSLKYQALERKNTIMRQTTNTSEKNREILNEISSKRAKKSIFKKKKKNSLEHMIRSDQNVRTDPLTLLDMSLGPGEREIPRHEKIWKRERVSYIMLLIAGLPVARMPAG